VIINSVGTQAICSLGWVHKGSLWAYSIGDASPRIVKLSDAKYLSLKAGKRDCFSLVHHWDGDKLDISAHNHSEPRRPISCISLRLAGSGRAQPEASLTGDSSIWQELPRAYVAFAFGGFHLFLVNLNGEVSMQAFSWYSDTDYDKGYQGIIGVEEIPNSSLLIVSIQRDSSPILYDPDTGKAVKKLSLADRRGNPDFVFRSSANEFWATDYDHIVKINATTLDVIATKQLQEAGQVGRQFIGDFSFDRSERLCLVARPFGGDVIGLDCDSMRQTYRAELGKQPLEAGLLGDDTVVAVDWKSGEFLSGRIEKAF
jgi:hypothetical protein